MVLERTDTVLEQPPERPAAHPRRLPIPLIAAACIVLAAELGVRAISPRLPEPIDWPQRVAGVMAAQMERAGPVDVAFVGSSAVHNAFEPSVLRDLRAYNAGLQRAGIVAIDAWVREVVLPRLRPSTVVLGLTSRDLNDNGTIQRGHLEEYLRSPGRARAVGAETALQVADRYASNASALVRYRRYLRRPADLADDVLRGGDRLEPQVALGPLGEPRDPDSDAPYRVRDWPYPHRNGELYAFDMRASLRTLRALVRELRARDIAVLLVDMPVVEDVYAPYHPRGRTDLLAYRASLGGVARSEGVPLWSPPSDQWADSALRVDDLHFNRAGAAVFSRALAVEMSDAGAARP